MAVYKKLLFVVAVMSLGMVEAAALIDAVKNNEIEKVKTLLAPGIKTNLSEKDDKGGTALMWAVVQGKKEIVELLIKAGANVNEKTEYGDTALMVAATGGPY